MNADVMDDTTQPFDKDARQKRTIYTTQENSLGAMNGIEAKRDLPRNC